MKGPARKKIQVAIRHVELGDRQRALEILKAMLHVAFSTGNSEQLWLPIAIGLEFKCDRLSARIKIRDCLTRRSRVWPSGSGKGCPTEQAMICQGCGIGAEFADRFPTYEPPPNRIPRAVGGKHA